MLTTGTGVDVPSDKPVTWPSGPLAAAPDMLTDLRLVPESIMSIISLLGDPSGVKIVRQSLLCSSGNGRSPGTVLHDRCLYRAVIRVPLFDHFADDGRTFVGSHMPKGARHHETRRLVIGRVVIRESWTRAYLCRC